MKQKYIENNEQLGLLYNWKKIKDEFNKLNIPDDVYNPVNVPLGQAKWFIELSDRSTGKTTNWLLLGMVMNKLYGTQIQYVRQSDEDIAPKSSKNLFSVILKYDYVSKITDNKYNSVTYNARRWYYCNVDENGKVIDKATEHFMFMASVQSAENLKSSYNAPYGDLIIFDEFISRYYMPNEFVLFCDLVKTIIRDRISPIIVMLANTIDKHSQYFNELDIYDNIQRLNKGQYDILTTPKGTKVYVELIGSTIKKQTKRDKVNKLFFGFKNQNLASITGEDWAMNNYQHIPRDNYKTLFNQLYLYHNNKYVRLEIVNNEKLGVCVYVHWATYIYDDSIILTTVDRTDNRYMYKFGEGNLSRFIIKMYETNRFYYATNDIGSFFENYIKYCNKL